MKSHDVEKLREDLECPTKDLKYEDGSQRAANIWPNGARALLGTVVHGKRKLEVGVYRNIDRTLFTMDRFGVKRKVQLDEVTFHQYKD